MQRLALTTCLLLFVAMASPADAKVSAEQAKRLQADLTPLGAERAGNDSGSIPEWTGGLTTPPPGYQGWQGPRINPFADDKPEFVITHENLDQYKANLSAGQIALFGQFDDYKMPVYKTRRSLAKPQHVYDAVYANATRAELVADGEGLTGATIGVPFPIPKSGREVIWNHKVRYRGISVRRWNNQFAVTSSGTFTPVRLREDVTFVYSYPGITPQRIKDANVLLYFLQIVQSPARLAGQILLVHETANQVEETRRAWLYNPGQRRVRRAPNVGYDNPGTGTDGLRTNDQTDMYNGAMDRYTWKLVGKKELYIPYNSYQLNQQKYSYDDVLQARHINQDLTRYELHRVWVVESYLRDGTSHIYKRRTFHVDEDSWQIAVVDCYDNQDRMWRIQEAHLAQAYDPEQILTTGSAAEIIYDLQNSRYIAQALNNEDEQTHSIEVQNPSNYYNPRSMQRFAFQ